MGRGIRRGIFILLCLSVLTGLLGGCAGDFGNTGDKIVVTTLYLSDFPQLEKLVESVYPDIDLQCEIMPYYTEQLRRLKKGAGPDLVITNQPSSEEIQSYLLDISDSRASSAYDGTIMRRMMLEGKTYLLPLPGQFSGYIVNETLFEQAGLPLPTNNRELIASLVRLKELGLGVGEDGMNFAIQSEYASDLGMYYVGYMVPDFLGTVEGVKWLADYSDKEAVFKGSWDKMFSLTDEMIKNGLLDPAPLGLRRNSIRGCSRMGDGTLAAVFGNSMLYSHCWTDNMTAVRAGIAPEYSYRMLPLFSEEGNEPWILFSLSSYIGINADAGEEKQEACRRVLELLSTQEGQDAVIKDMRMGASCLRDYKPDGSFVPAGVEKYVESGYVYIVNFPDKIIERLGSDVQKMMAGKLTERQVIEAVDKFYYEGLESPDNKRPAVGMMAGDLLLQSFNVRRRETELGNFLADCVAEVTGTAIAAVSGGNIRSSLYAGEVYEEDLEALFPIENRVVILEMDGQTVWDMLENGVSACDGKFPGGRFLQISGLSYTFDSGKQRGSRLREVTLPDGSALDMNGVYRVAVTDYMAGAVGYAEGNGDGYTMLNWYDGSTPKGRIKMVEETGYTYRDILKIFFNNHQGEIAGAGLEGRITDLAQK